MGFFSRLVGRKQNDTQLQSAGRFAPVSPFKLPSGALVGIVGESYYTEAIRATRRSASRELPAEVEEEFLQDLARQEASELKWFTAYLVPEPENPYDANAIAVYSEAGKIGHLSKENAVAYAEVFKRVRTLGANCAVCTAFERRDQGSIVLALSLPTYCLPEVNAARRQRAWEAWNVGEDWETIASRLDFRDVTHALKEARKHAVESGETMPERKAETGRSSQS